MSYGVANCPSCARPWAVDLRGATASCPRCSHSVELASARLAWKGDSPQEAQAVAGQLSIGPAAAAVQALTLPRARAVPRHDSPVDAAAAQGNGIRNKSERAEAVARALARLRGSAPHDELVRALERAGIDRERAEAEVNRMLATDILVEPRAGHYRMVG